MYSYLFECMLEARMAAHNANVVPHELLDSKPVMPDDDAFL